MRRQFEGGVYIQRSRSTHTRVHSFNNEPSCICTYNARAHTFIVVDPVPCGDISRVAFIRMCWLKYGATFRGQRDFEKIR